MGKNRNCSGDFKFIYGEDQRCELITNPTIQMMTPTRERRSEIKAKGRPNRNPRGWHSQSSPQHILSQFSSLEFSGERKALNVSVWLVSQLISRKALKLPQMYNSEQTPKLHCRVRYRNKYYLSLIIYYILKFTW